MSANLYFPLVLLSSLIMTHVIAVNKCLGNGPKLIAGRTCFSDVWSYDEHNLCYGYDKTPNKLMFWDDKTKQFSMTKKDCFGDNDPNSICQLNFQELPQCYKSALARARPQVCSIEQHSTTCDKYVYRRTMNYVITTDKRKHWVSSLTISQSDNINQNTIRRVTMSPNCSNPNVMTCSDLEIADVLKITCDTFDTPKDCELAVLTQPKSQTFLTVDNCNIPILCYGSATVNYQNHATPSFEPSILDKDSKVSCENSTIAVESFNSKPTLAVACSKTHCFDAIFEQKRAIIPRDFEDMIRGADYTVRTFAERTLLKEVSLRCPPKELCESIPCTLCDLFIYNPRCWSVYHWVAILSVVYLSLTLILTVISLLKPLIHAIHYMLKMLYHLTACCVGLSKRHGKAAITKISRHVDKVKEMDPESMEMVSDRREQRRAFPPMDSPLMKGRNLNRWESIMSIVLFLGLLCVAVADTGAEEEMQMDKNIDPMDSVCQNSTVLSSETTECTPSGHFYDCSTKVATFVELLPVGQTTCLLLEPKSEINKFSHATIQFTVKDLNLICNKRSLYFTRDVTWSHVGEKRCPSAGWCSGNTCQNLKQNDDLPFENHVPKENIGKTTCRGVSSSGNWCFYQTDACLAYRWYATASDGDVWEVFDCPSWDESVVLKVSVMDSYNKRFTTMTIINNVDLSFEGLSFKATLKVGTVLPILGKKFMSNLRTKDVYLVDAEDPGVQTAGKLGMVQCKEENEAKGLVGCRFASDTCKCSNYDDSLTCDCKTTNPKDYAIPENHIPLRHGGMMFDYQSNRLLAQYPAKMTGSVLLSGATNVKVLKDSTHQVCNFKIIEAKGCYDCLAGVEIKYVCRSEAYFHTHANCGPIMLSLFCGNTEEVKSTNVLFGESVMNLNCLAQCDPGKTLVALKAELDYHGYTQYSNSSRLAIPMVEPESATGLWDWIKKLYHFKWVSTVWFVTIGIVGLVILHIILSWFVVPAVRTLKAKQS